MVLVEMLVTRRRVMGAAVTWTGFEVSRRSGIEGVGDVRYLARPAITAARAVSFMLGREFGHFKRFYR